MKSLKVSNLGEIRNELNKYKKGKKLDIRQFNQAARLAWLGKAVMQPLDPTDAECNAYLMYLDFPEALGEKILDLDEDLVGRIHILDGEQGDALLETMRNGFNERAKLYQELDKSDFYFRHFYASDADKDAQKDEG